MAIVNLLLLLHCLPVPYYQHTVSTSPKLKHVKVTESFHRLNVLQATNPQCGPIFLSSSVQHTFSHRSAAMSMTHHQITWSVTRNARKLVTCAFNSGSCNYCSRYCWHFLCGIFYYIFFDVRHINSCYTCQPFVFFSLFF